MSGGGCGKTKLPPEGPEHEHEDALDAEPDSEQKQNQQDADSGVDDRAERDYLDQAPEAKEDCSADERSLEHGHLLWRGEDYSNMTSQGLALKAIDPSALDDAFWVDQRGVMMEATLATWKDLYISAAQEAAAAAGLPFDLEVINLAADRYIAGFASEWWAKLEATTREGLRAAIAQANAEGLGVDYVFQASKPLFGEARALNIAVTETTRVLGGAAQEVMRESGVPEWDWDTAMDAVVCDLCKEKAAGSPYPMTTPFEPRHVGCRCAPSPRMAAR